MTKNYLDSPSKKPLDSVSKNSIDITGLGNVREAMGNPFVNSWEEDLSPKDNPFA
ncbi:hypothetical protein M5J06_00005 [Corynebacterium sp. B5-R-101]|uniref:Uncharacterized protein n=1 Tax=Corynebacterium intestinale TaxID=2943492 RepID=A0ABT0T5Z3_9CORY|nr:hypothetical protein [Corynebacterium intestinale]MCL8492524.1 hypothetical protein [Corynebacterium intestinale]MCP1388756.1 hypothetical protein [Corynebacterium intestinale]